MFRTISDEYPDAFVPPLPEPKQRLSVELIKLATAIISAFVVLSSLPRDHPWVFKAALGVCGLLLLWYGMKWIWRGICWLHRRSEDGRFVSEEQARLRDMLESFQPFVADHDGRSIREAIRNASMIEGDLFEGPIGADFIISWFNSFALELQNPARSVSELMQRCCQFGRLVQEFTDNYPVRAQRYFERKPLSQTHMVQFLDQCREEYNAFLREFEKWSRSVATRSQGRLDHPEWLRLVPISQIPKVKPFAVQKVNS